MTHMLHYNPTIARGVYLWYHRIDTFTKFLKRKLVLFVLLFGIHISPLLFIHIKSNHQVGVLPLCVPQILKINLHKLTNSK